jgi:hypothetical protein
MCVSACSYRHSHADTASVWRQLTASRVDADAAAAVECHVVTACSSAATTRVQRDAGRVECEREQQCVRVAHVDVHTTDDASHDDNYNCNDDSSNGGTFHNATEASNRLVRQKI